MGSEVVLVVVLDEFREPLGSVELDGRVQGDAGGRSGLAWLG